jgi:hypothetical protein
MIRSDPKQWGRISWAGSRYPALFIEKPLPSEDL